MNTQANVRHASNQSKRICSFEYTGQTHLSVTVKAELRPKAEAETRLLRV